jgi:pimeloyl-ACP methyl ester carboxylesterase
MVGSRGWAVLAAALVLSLGSACGGGTPAGGVPTTHASSTHAEPVAGAGCPSDASGGRQVRFGKDLGGLVFGTGRTGVVLSHQAGGGLCQWVPYGKALAKQGYRVLAFDFPGSGSSILSTAALDEAVTSAAGFLRTDGATRVVLIGASMGGTASLAAAVEISPPVAGVVSVSGPTIYDQTQAIDAAPKLAVPVLYVVAEDDDPSFVASAYQLYRLTPASDPRKLVVLPSGGHGVQLLNADPNAPAAPEVTKFLRTYAPPS